jgi:hypothetical protein
MRAIRWLLISLIVLAGLYVVADFVLRGVAEDQVATSLQASLELSKKPQVDLGGFPFLIRAFDGRLDEVILEGADLSAGDQPLKEVRLTLHNVRFSATALVTGRDTMVRFGSSDGRLELTGQDVTEALKDTGLDAKVRLSGGEAQVSVAGIPAEVRVRVTLEGQTLVFRPVGLLIPIDVRLDLSDLVPAVRYRDVRIEGSTAVLTFALTTKRFDV